MNSQTANTVLKMIVSKGLLVMHGMWAIASTALNDAGFPTDIIDIGLTLMDIYEVTEQITLSNDAK